MKTHRLKYITQVSKVWRFLPLLLAACFAPANIDAPPTVETPPDAIAVTAPAPAPTPDLSQPAHPMSIAALRQRSYDSSFTLEQTLDAGVNYDRYIASYLSDGYRIYALLTIPHGERPPAGFPVVIFNHGYIPPNEYRTTERYVAYVDAFARSGYIVIKSDYRGHGLSEGTAEGAYDSPAYTIDVLNAVTAARRLPEADPSRIGMWGHSMGGYITLRAMVADQGIRAGVIWAGVVASYQEMFETWFRRAPSGWRAAIIEQYGTPTDNPAFWDNLSANTYLHELTGPVQIHHGTGDTTVPYSYSVLLDEQIRAVNGHTELLLYPGDDHNIASNRDGALAVSVVFFDRWVAGRYDAS